MWEQLSQEQPLVLASASPQRRRLLKQAGIPFTVHPADIDETPPRELPFQEMAIEIARKKVQALLKMKPRLRRRRVLGADTFIVLHDTMLGKPSTEKAAAEMLQKLAGKMHRVITGIVLYLPESGDSEGGNQSFRTSFAVTDVYFAPLDREEIDWYVSTGEWKGAAGGYRIQGKGAVLIKKIEGSFSNVVGLPLHHLYGILRANRDG